MTQENNSGAAEASKKTFRVRQCREAEVTGEVTAGLSIVLIGPAALRGTETAAMRLGKRLDERFSACFAERCRNAYRDHAVEADEKMLQKAGVKAFCLPGDGGLYAALWDLSSAGGRGFDIDLRKIPLLQETVEVCEIWDLNPYRLDSTGCILAAASCGESLAAQYRAMGKKAEVIGWFDRTKAGKIRSGETTAYLDFPAPDEIHKTEQQQTEKEKEGGNGL